MINKNWSRWIVASLSKYFTDNKGSYFVWLENQPTDSLKSQLKWAELRIDGPRIHEPSKDQYFLEIDIDLLCCSKPSNNIYDIESIVGWFASLCVPCIPMLKLGNQPGDDNSQFGILELRADLDPHIRITKWGTDSADVPITRTAIEAFYKMDLYLGE